MNSKENITKILYKLFEVKIKKPKLKSGLLLS